MVALMLENVDGLFRMVDENGMFRWQMGLRRLRDGWLDVTASDREFLLAEKRHLLESHYSQVVAMVNGMEGPSTEIFEAVTEFVAAAGFDVDVSAGGGVHPLVAAALHTVEDLVVMVERDGQLVFGGGVVCFPNRWDLPSKLGKTMREVHAPVPGLNGQMGSRVDSVLSRLRLGEIFGRCGWGVIDSSELFQPVNPVGKTIGDANFSDLFLRVEEETLRRFKSQQAILFTIRTHLYSLVDVLADPVLAEEFRKVAVALPPEVAAYKNMMENQPDLQTGTQFTL